MIIKFIKSFFKKNTYRCHYPNPIIANREPTEKDLHEHGAIWVVINEKRERVAIFYRMQHSINKIGWFKFVPE